MIKPHRLLSALAAIPGLAYLAMAAVIIAAMACKVGVKYSFNINEGWNAYWANAAWSGADLYPPLAELKLDNYPPLWFYLTGALGHLVGDNIRAGRAVAAAALLLNGVVIALIAREIAETRKAAWLAGAAFLALFGLFHQDYAGADDPQVLASLFMTLAVLMGTMIGQDGRKALPVCRPFLNLTDLQDAVLQGGGRRRASRAGGNAPMPRLVPSSNRSPYLNPSAAWLHRGRELAMIRSRRTRTPTIVMLAWGRGGSGSVRPHTTCRTCTYGERRRE